MGTRHLILVWYKGKWQIAQYGQWDGYPTGQGLKVAKFLINAREMDENMEILPIDLSKLNIDNIEALKLALNSDKIYTPTAEQCEALEKEAYNMGQDAEELSCGMRLADKMSRELEPIYYLRCAQNKPLLMLYPSLSPDAGAKILDIVAYSDGKIPLVVRPDEVVDGSIEWAYVVDLDRELFELYEGLEDYDGQGSKGRFDDEPFVSVSQGDRPHLRAGYDFPKLRDMGVEGLVNEMKALQADDD